VSPAPAVTSTLCRFPLVVLQQTSQSFSTPHCSFVPSCFRPRRKQDPVVFALVIALLVVMYEILLPVHMSKSISAGIGGTPTKRSGSEVYCGGEAPGGLAFRLEAAVPSPADIILYPSGISNDAGSGSICLISLMTVVISLFGLSLNI